MIVLNGSHEAGGDFHVLP